MTDRPDGIGPDEFETYSELFRVKAAAEDFDDQQHAIADRDVGRYRKHIQNRDVDPVTGEKRSSVSERIRRTLDWLLLNDPEFARIHNTAMTALAGAEDATQVALEKILLTITGEQVALKDMESRAARLEDGTLVFRNAKGEIVTADGNRVGDNLAAGIVWRGDEPTYEEYLAQLERVEDLRRDEAELRGIETELGDIRGALTDNEAPPSAEQVETLTDRIEELQGQADSLTPRNIEFISDVEAADRTRNSDSVATSIPAMPRT